MENKEYFMLLVENSEKAPKFIHECRTLATIEANRLSKLFRKPVYLLKIENVIRTFEIIELKTEMKEPKDYFQELPF